MFSYNFLYSLALTCFILEVLAVIVYIRFLWIFRFYYGPEQEQSLLWNLACLIFFGAVFFQMAMGMESFGWSFEDNAQFLLNDAKLTFTTVLMLLFCGSRWREMATMPLGCWERRARLWLVLFTVVAMSVRFLGVLSCDQLAVYRWENGTPATEEQMQEYFADKPQSEEVRFFKGKPVYPPQSAIKAAVADFKEAVKRSQKEKAKRKKMRELRKRRRAY